MKTLIILSLVIVGCYAGPTTLIDLENEEKTILTTTIAPIVETTSEAIPTSTSTSKDVTHEEVHSNSTKSKVTQNISKDEKKKDRHMQEMSPMPMMSRKSMERAKETMGKVMRTASMRHRRASMDLGVHMTHEMPKRAKSSMMMRMPNMMMLRKDHMDHMGMRMRREADKISEEAGHVNISSKPEVTESTIKTSEDKKPEVVDAKINSTEATHEEKSDKLPSENKSAEKLIEKPAEKALEQDHEGKPGMEGKTDEKPAEKALKHDHEGNPGMEDKTHEKPAEKLAEKLVEKLEELDHDDKNLTSKMAVDEIPKETHADEHKDHKHGLLKSPEECDELQKKKPQIKIFHFKEKVGGEDRVTANSQNKDEIGEIENFTAFIKTPMDPELKTRDNGNIPNGMNGDAYIYPIKSVKKRSTAYGGSEEVRLVKTAPRRSAQMVRSSGYEEQAPIRSVAPLRSSEYEEEAPIRSVAHLRSSEYEEAAPVRLLAPLRSSEYEEVAPIRSVAPRRSTELKYAVRHSRPVKRVRVAKAREAPVMSYGSYEEPAPVPVAPVVPVITTATGYEKPDYAPAPVVPVVTTSVSNYEEPAYAQPAPVRSAPRSPVIRAPPPRVRTLKRIAPAPVVRSQSYSLFDEVSHDDGYGAVAEEPKIRSDDTYALPIFDIPASGDDEYSMQSQPIRISSNRYRRSTVKSGSRSEYSAESTPAVKKVKKSSGYSAESAPVVKKVKKSSGYSAESSPAVVLKSSGYSSESRATPVIKKVRSSKYSSSTRTRNSKRYRRELTEEPKLPKMPTRTPIMKPIGSIVPKKAMVKKEEPSKDLLTAM